jgi:hypothetical protein
MSNDNNPRSHGITDDEVGGRLKRAAWGMVLLGPAGALIGSAMKSNPTNPLNNSNRTPRQRQRDRKWFTVLCVLGIIIMLISAARAQPLGHNGSIMDMQLDQRTGLFSIVYAQPKPSLLAIGVTPGTLLIRGQMSPPNLVQAVAHVYDPFGCGAVPYPVSGRYDGPVLILEGPAPVVWAGSCVIAEYIWTHNSHLRFDLLK